jgi:type III pantothenate kinase
MLLAIDIRSTRIVLGLFSGSGGHAKLARRWRMHTDPLMTADEFALQMRGMLGEHLREISGVAALSTVPAVTGEIRHMMQRYFEDSTAVLIEPGVRTGIALLVDNPKEVGPDRIANCLAAHHLHNSPAIVVDFGAATVVDAVSAKGEFLGGVIAPGVEVSVDALIRTTRLRRVELARPRSVIGKSSLECIQAGAVFGFAGLVDGLVERIRGEQAEFAGRDVAVVATGDSAPLIVSESRTIDRHEPDLTLTGLRLVYERNKRYHSRRE